MALPLPLCNMASANSPGTTLPPFHNFLLLSLSENVLNQSFSLQIPIRSLWLDLKEILSRFPRLELITKAKPMSSLLWQLEGHLNKGVTRCTLGHHPCWLPEVLTVCLPHPNNGMISHGLYCCNCLVPGTTTPVPIVQCEPMVCHQRGMSSDSLSLASVTFLGNLNTPLSQPMPTGW